MKRSGRNWKRVLLARENYLRQMNQSIQKKGLSETRKREELPLLLAAATIMTRRREGRTGTYTAICIDYYWGEMHQASETE